MKQIAVLCVGVIGALASSSAITVSDVTAQQRYPWNGMVDITFSFSGTASEQYNVSVTATDVVGNTNITMKTLSKVDGSAVPVPYLATAGEQHIVWNASTDLGANAKYDGLRFAVTVSEQVSYPTSGLKVYWPFDGNGTDASGNGFSLSGTSVSYVADRFGNAKSCVYFNGSASLTLSKAIGVNKTMTFSFWAKPQKSDYYAEDITSGNGFGYGNFGYAFDDFPMIIIPSYKMGNGEIGIALGMGRFEIFQADADYGNYLCCYYTRRGVYGDGWHHYAITISNSGAPVVWMDGIQLTGTSTSFHTTALIVATSLNFGGRATNSYYNYSSPGNQAYKGYIDDFMIYNRVLSSLEISQLYNMGL